ncbi:MAG: sigma-54 dependent transcriptional regulator [Puniceicoccales bacterium]|nr:sigma-54 dependent transcriptional regulator [Puniceicoccales bacterium]
MVLLFPRLLIVDDEHHTRDGLALALSDCYAISTAIDAVKAMEKLQAETFDLVLIDLHISEKSGMDIIRFCQCLNSPPICILMTAYGDVKQAVEAMKAGAADFLLKPLELSTLKTALKQALHQKKSDTSTKTITPLANSPSLIVGNSPTLRRAMEIAQRVAASNVTVLLMGETGVGKDLFAQEIHRLSARHDRPFLALNAAALPTEMIESQLFGHERGAFTDARQRHRGYFERANGGTLFLDEIGELPHHTQVKLLRALESKSFERLGGDETICIDVRFLAATNAQLEERIRMGDFREDLYYRMNVVSIRIPPLRERLEDLELLLNFFFQFHHSSPRITPNVLDALRHYAWPGNVRELRNFCDAMAALYPGEIITLEQMKSYFSCPLASPEQNFIPLPDKSSSITSQKATETGIRLETNFKNIRKILTDCGGNHTKAAKLLGISRSTLYRHLRENSDFSLDDLNPPN